MIEFVHYDMNKKKMLRFKNNKNRLFGTKTGCLLGKQQQITYFQQKISYFQQKISYFQQKISYFQQKISYFHQKIS